MILGKMEGNAIIDHLNHIISIISSMNISTKFFHHLKRPLYYIPIAILLVVGGYFIYKNQQSGGANQKVTIVPAEFVQDVNVTGKVVSAENVDLGFEQSGRVAGVSVNVGDKVRRGQTLAYLSNGNQRAAVLQRQALLDAENARLAQVVRGSRPEDISLAQTDVDSAKANLERARQIIIDDIKDAYVKSDDVIVTRVDQMYTDPRSVLPKIIPFDGYEAQQSLNDQRLRIGEIIKIWGVSIQNITTNTYTDSDLFTARVNLRAMTTILDALAIATTDFKVSNSLPQVTIDKYKTDISQARTTINAVISTLNIADQTLQADQLAYQRAEQQFTLKKNGSTAEDVQTEQAQVKSAEAQLESAQADLSKTFISAPLDGLVTKVDIKAGEIASPNTPVISLISASQYQLESYVSENDVARVRVGQVAKVTLDAYGKDVIFDATVTEVDPAETIQDGVSTYKTKLQFSNADTRIKSGMTANIMVETERRQGVIIVPQNAVITRNGDKFVRIYSSNGNSSEQQVHLGHIDQNGRIEVVSGLSVGDVILVPSN